MSMILALAAGGLTAYGVAHLKGDGNATKAEVWVSLAAGAAVWFFVLLGASAIFG